MDLPLLISFCALIVSIIAIFYSYYIKKHFLLISQQNESLKVCIDFFNNQIENYQTNKKEIMDPEEYLSYQFYTEHSFDVEDFVKITETLNKFVDNFKSSSDYPYLPKQAKMELDRLFDYDFDNVNTYYDYVFELKKINNKFLNMLQ